MSFEPASVLSLVDLAMPEPDPNLSPPLDPRIFRSPSSPEGVERSIFLWLEEASGPADVSVWFRAGSRSEHWIWAGTLAIGAATLVDPSRAVVVPGDAQITLRVMAGVDGQVVAGFRFPSSKDDAPGPSVSPGEPAAVVDQGAPGGSPWPVSVAGVATATRQDAANTALASLDAKTAALVAGRTPVDGSGVVQPVSGPADAALAKDSTLTDGSQRVGGNVAVTNASLASLDVALSTRALEAGGNLETIAANTGRQALDAQGRAFSAASDFYGRLRTTPTRLLVRGYQVEKASPVHFSSVVATGGSVVYNAVDGTYESTTTAASGSAAIDISNGIGHYRESFVLGGLISGSFGSTASANKRVEWGLFGGVASSATSLQTADAFGFYLENGALGVFRRTSLGGAYPGNTSDTPQSAWNVDHLDGAGPSGFTFVLADLLDEFLYEPRFVWLGAKGIQYVLAGRLVHEVDFTAAASRIQKPFARNPHMRAGVFMFNSGASTSLTFARNCSAVYTESDEAPIEYPLTVSRPAAITTPSASGRVPVIALRIASSARARIALPKSMEVRITNQDSLIEVLIGKASAFTFTGGAWATPASSPDTLVEQNVTATAVTIGGGAALLRARYVDNTGTGIATIELDDLFGETKRWIGIDGDGAQLNLVVTATGQAGNNGTISIRELSLREIG